MSTPAEEAAAYLTRLEADRRAAIAVSEAKAEEAKLIKARQEGFREALEILELQISTDNTEAEPVKSLTRCRRNIQQLKFWEDSAK
jgi:hypothetical protein